MKRPPTSTSSRLPIPELETLRELRVRLARGGLPAPDKRTASDGARVTAFTVVVELLRFFEELRRRTDGGERCRIVERDRPRETGRLVLDFVIEAEP